MDRHVLGFANPYLLSFPSLYSLVEVRSDVLRALRLSWCIHMDMLIEFSYLKSLVCEGIWLKMFERT